MTSFTECAAEYAVGIDIGGTNTKIGVVKGTELLCSSIIPTDVAQGPEATLKSIIAEVRRVCACSTRVKAVGIGIPGLTEDGILLSSANFPGWFNVPIQDVFQAELECPVNVQMDIDAIAMGECWAGGHGSRRRLFVLTLGTGVGAAAILDNHVYGGAGGFMLAGPFDHPEAPSTFLHLEDIVSGPSIVRRTREILSSQPGGVLQPLAEAGKLTVEAIAEAARHGDTTARHIWKNTGTYLGWAAVSITYLLFTDRIIVGGGVSRAGDLLIQPAREFFLRHVPRELASTRDITISTLGPAAGVIGAALAALQTSNTQK